MQYAGLIIEAETDNDAVGFYRAAGFEIVSLGEVHIGVERSPPFTDNSHI